MKFLVLNGPSINMLGIREPEIYGGETYDDLCEMITSHAIKNGIDVELYQSNHEGDLVDKICESYKKIDGIIINPAAYTHTSIAIADALRAVSIPAVEVHISDVDGREEYRRISYTKDACLKVVKGEGLKGYITAFDYLTEYLK